MSVQCALCIFSINWQPESRFIDVWQKRNDWMYRTNGCRHHTVVSMAIVYVSKGYQQIHLFSVFVNYLNFVLPFIFLVFFILPSFFYLFDNSHNNTQSTLWNLLVFSSARRRKIRPIPFSGLSTLRWFFFCHHFFSLQQNIVITTCIFFFLLISHQFYTDHIMETRINANKIKVCNCHLPIIKRLIFCKTYR